MSDADEAGRNAPGDSLRQGLQIAACLHVAGLFLGTILFELPKQTPSEGDDLFDGLGYSFSFAAFLLGWLQLVYLIPLAGLFGKRGMPVTRDGLLLYAALACVIPTACAGGAFVLAA